MKTNWDYTELKAPYLNRPNYSAPAMRSLVQERTKHLQNIEWPEGVGEATEQPDD